MDMQVKLADFHKKFGFPLGQSIRDSRCRNADDRILDIQKYLSSEAEDVLDAAIESQKVSNDERLYRLHLMMEELAEVAEAMHRRESESALADGLTDLLYVVIGTMVTYGFDVQAMFDEVHQSNMSKHRSVGNERMRDKGPNYRRPDFVRVIDETKTRCFICRSELVQVGDVPAGRWHTECPKCGKDGVAR